MSYVIDGTANSVFKAAGETGMSDGDFLVAWVKSTAISGTAISIFNTSADYYKIELISPNIARVKVNQQFSATAGDKTPIVSDTWTAVICEYRGGRPWNYSINGVIGSQGGFSGGVQASASPVISLGADNYAGNQFMLDGKIGPVAIYSALGVNQTEIDAALAEIVAATPVDQITNATLREWWDGNDPISKIGSIELLTTSGTIDTADNPYTSGPTVITTGPHKPGDAIGFTPAGFAGAVTTATITDSAGITLPLTSVSDAGATIPAFNTGGQQAALFGTVTLTVGDGAETAEVTFTLDPATGYTAAVAAGLTIPSTNPLDWNYGAWTSEVANGDVVYDNDTLITYNANGSTTFNPVDLGASYTATYYIIDGFDSILTKVTKNYLNGVPSQINRKLTGKKLTSLKLTGQKL